MGWPVANDGRISGTRETRQAGGECPTSGRSPASTWFLTLAHEKVQPLLPHLPGLFTPQAMKDQQKQALRSNDHGEGDLEPDGDADHSRAGGQEPQSPTQAEHQRQAQRSNHAAPDGSQLSAQVSLFHGPCRVLPHVGKHGDDDDDKHDPVEDVEQGKGEDEPEEERP